VGHKLAKIQKSGACPIQSSSDNSFLGTANARLACFSLIGVDLRYDEYGV